MFAVAMLNIFWFEWLLNRKAAYGWQKPAMQLKRNEMDYQSFRALAVRIGICKFSITQHSILNGTDEWTRNLQNAYWNGLNWLFSPLHSSMDRTIISSDKIYASGLKLKPFTNLWVWKYDINKRLENWYQINFAHL